MHLNPVPFSILNLNLICNQNAEFKIEFQFSSITVRIQKKKKNLGKCIQKHVSVIIKIKDVSVIFFTSHFENKTTNYKPEIINVLFS